MSKDERHVIVVEGANYTGKSHFFKELYRAFSGSRVIENHDYYNKQAHALKNAGHAITDEEIRSGNLPTEVRKMLQSYNQRMVESVLRFAWDAHFEHILIERLHGTDIVYSQVLWQEKPDYTEVEHKLNGMRATLVVLTVDDDTLDARITTSGRSRVTNPKAPYHLIDRDLLKRKRDLYEQFYSTSQIQRKYLFTSNDSSDVRTWIDTITR